MPNERIIARGYHGTTIKAAVDIKSHLNFEREDQDWHWLGYGIYFWQDTPLRAWEWAEHKVREDLKNGKHSEPAVISASIDLSKCLDMLDTRFWPLVDSAWTNVAEFYASLGEPAPQQIGPLEAFSYAALSRVIETSGSSGRSIFVEKEILEAFAPEACARIVYDFQQAGRELPAQFAISDLSKHIARRYGKNQRDCAVMNTAFRLMKEFGEPITTARAAFMEGNECYEGSWFRDRSHVQIAVVEPDAIRQVVSDIRIEDAELLKVGAERSAKHATPWTRMMTA